MHSELGQARRKEKKIAKQPRNGQRDRRQNQTQEVPQPLSIKHSQQTPQERRRELAREALAKLGHQKPSVVEDDFFVVEKEEAKKLQQQHEAISMQLRQQYMRKQNKLFENLSQSYAVNGFGEGIEYKGHKLCITAFEVTPTHIYSCSKDKSIIKWDRQTKQKQFISLGKDPNHHRSDILCLSLHSNQNVLATAGDDCQIKLWDTRTCGLIDTLRGHKNTINGIKFGVNSNNLCSAGADLTFKQWDFAQRGIIGTFYEHNAEILDIDCINDSDYLTSGYDRQVIAWKTERETKVVFKGHNYAIDRVRAINLERFITACQDGSIYLWSHKKTKPVFKFNDAHPGGWISALDNIKQSNIFATAGIDHVVKLWGIEGESSGLTLLREVQVNGIITDLQLRPDYLAVAECDQLRLGRWVTDKCRNKIKIFPVLGGN